MWNAEAWLDEQRWWKERDPGVGRGGARMGWGWGMAGEPPAPPLFQGCATGSCVSPKELFSLTAQLELPGDQVRHERERHDHVPSQGPGSALCWKHSTRGAPSGP